MNSGERERNLAGNILKELKIEQIFSQEAIGDEDRIEPPTKQPISGEPTIVVSDEVPLPLAKDMDIDSREWQIFRLGLESFTNPELLGKHIINSDLEIARGLSDSVPRALTEGARANRPTPPNEIKHLVEEAVGNLRRVCPLTATRIVLEGIANRIESDDPGICIYGHRINTSTGGPPTPEAAFYLIGVINSFVEERLAEVIKSCSEGKPPADLRELGANADLLPGPFEKVIEEARGSRVNPQTVENTHKAICRLNCFLEYTDLAERNGQIRERLNRAHRTLLHMDSQEERPPSKMRKRLGELMAMVGRKISLFVP